ncbi:MAG: aminodeoxychorismate lyase [Povalibacter sp.]
MSRPLAILVNGESVPPEMRAVDVMDRGLNYGDGLFETALLKQGSVRFLGSHLARLRRGCDRLGIRFSERVLLEEITQLVGSTSDAVLKILVTRGSSGRGYRPDPQGDATRILSLYAPTPVGSPGGLRLRWCEMRLSRNERLAGIKHLNRLEQVLAQAEWTSDEADEALMLDTAGEIVCATAANVFIIREGVLTTPDLRYCGVDGVMRAEVLRSAEALNVPVSIQPLWPEDLNDASEMFLTNAVRGIRSVASLGELNWQHSRVSDRLSGALRL